jgi:hypothetical protein
VRNSTKLTLLSGPFALNFHVNSSPHHKPPPKHLNKFSYDVIGVSIIQWTCCRTPRFLSTETATSSISSSSFRYMTKALVQATFITGNSRAYSTPTSQLFSAFITTVNGQIGTKGDGSMNHPASVRRAATPLSEVEL